MKLNNNMDPTHVKVCVIIVYKVTSVKQKPLLSG